MVWPMPWLLGNIFPRAVGGAGDSPGHRNGKADRTARLHIRQVDDDGDAVAAGRKRDGHGHVATGHEHNVRTKTANVAGSRAESARQSGGISRSRRKRNADDRPAGDCLQPQSRSCHQRFFHLTLRTDPQNLFVANAQSLKLRYGRECRIYSTTCAACAYPTSPCSRNGRAIGDPPGPVRVRPPSHGLVPGPGRLLLLSESTPLATRLGDGHHDGPARGATVAVGPGARRQAPARRVVHNLLHTPSTVLIR